jgi:hypothetical protein
MLVGEDPQVLKAWCGDGTPDEMMVIMDEALLIINSTDPDHRRLLFPEEDS